MSSLCCGEFSLLARPASCPRPNTDAAGTRPLQPFYQVPSDEAFSSSALSVLLPPPVTLPLSRLPGSLCPANPKDHFLDPRGGIFPENPTYQFLVPQAVSTPSTPACFWGLTSGAKPPPKRLSFW